MKHNKGSHWQQIASEFRGKLSPCPCCGEKGELREEGEGAGEVKGLYWGSESADSVGVQCYSCGLRMIVHYPDKWPEDCETFEDIERKSLAEAVERWNRRTS